MSQKRLAIRQRRIGEKFPMDGKRFVVRAAENVEKPCHECAFRDGDNCAAKIEIAGLCYKGMRRDDVQAVFVEL